MESGVFNYADFLEIFGEDRKIEMYDGVIVIGAKTFDEVIETYLRIKAEKQKKTE